MTKDYPRKESVIPALRLFAVVSASLLLLAKADGSGAEGPQTPQITETTTYAVKLGDDGTCLTEINGARKKAGFNDFVIPQEGKDKRLPEEGERDSGNYAEWVWKPVCAALIKEEAGEGKSDTASETFGSGTYAYHVVDDTSAPNCAGVVDQWKKAYSNFSAMPPSRKDDNTVYSNQDNVSLVAMYNPSDDATADCRIVTCTKTTKTSTAAPGKQGGQEVEAETKEGSALICMTTPDVLSEKSESAPFTEEQWGRIVNAIENSASALLPGFLGLAAVALGFVATM
ncbi:SAG family member [Eimeria mitis]|uniref:SAG family member n=1 Tax=Eimeria mitis TaxID=44415 RepID=U6K1E0_9EIME|nr:SAG family member [Eimeria mitis]CDJ31545.1 SAG family member [Eimeria mitis]